MLEAKLISSDRVLFKHQGRSTACSHSSQGSVVFGHFYDGNSSNIPLDYVRLRPYLFSLIAGVVLQTVHEVKPTMTPAVPATEDWLKVLAGPEHTYSLPLSPLYKTRLTSSILSAVS
ncbi:hypothetical protein BGW80DRAFT_1465713 [Lactifluus volemus]|nr:hypothetical protein BGW80DRAFT_1465713 [Lactifluus volemus]